ncbi:hypothetical protein ANO11243_049360 [Dothideomycetidae sp. 11243]|nr:hypothetical protein ANO11243_049360 [fungal sp. No.11243]
MDRTDMAQADLDHTDMVDTKADRSPPGYDNAVASGSYIRPQARKIYDPSVTIEEYIYYARKTRAEQDGLEKPKTQWAAFFSKKEAHHEVDEKSGANVATHDQRMHISDEEWTNASRAFRTASMGAAFYLITTDILGPFAAPFAIATLGYGPGIALFTVFGFFAGYSGYLVWHVFMGVDSHEFPARNYGDLAFRTWGRIARHVLNFLQAVALLLLLGQVVILFGQNISQMSKFRLCYAVCPLLFVIVGFFLGQIRTLRN